MEKIYHFSEQTLKERRNLLFLLAGIMIAAFVVSALYFSVGMDASGRQFMAIMVMILSVVELSAMGLTGYFMLRQVKKIQLILNDEALVRRRKSKEERVAFKDIISCTAVRKPQGQLQMIKIKTPRQQLNLNGFTAMEEVLTIISAALSVPVLEKKQKIDWNSPQAVIGAAVVTIVIFLAIAGIDRHLMNRLYGVMLIAFGAYFLCFRPLKRQSGNSFAKYDWVCGLIFLLIGLWQLFD